MSNICAMFSGLGLVSTICFIVGIIFLVIEIFIPGFGVFGFCGIGLTGFSVIFKICIGDSVEEVLWTLLIAVIVIIILLSVFIYSAKKGLISRSALMNNGTALPTFYNSSNLEFLIGETAECASDLKPVGKVKIEEEIYDATSQEGYLDVGTKVEVVSIENNTLCVRLLNKKEIKKVKGDK